MAATASATTLAKPGRRRVAHARRGEEEGSKEHTQSRDRRWANDRSRSRRWRTRSSLCTSHRAVKAVFILSRARASPGGPRGW